MKIQKLIIFIIIILVIPNVLSAQTLLSELEKVKEIKLLESNRDDVRKIFANDKLKTESYSKYVDNFETSDVEIQVNYSKGKCDDDEDEEFDVAEWKVENVTITPEKSIKLIDIKNTLSKFDVKLSKFRKERIFINAKNLYMYHNKNLGIMLNVNKDEVNEISFFPTKKYYSLLCDKELAKKFSSTKSIFKDPLKNRMIISDKNDPGDVTNLILSLTEITANCLLSDSLENNSCSKGVKVIAVFAVGKDPENDVLIYNYTVTGGKVIGTGEKILWDLSDVKAGTYKITAAVDDGCGFCGKTMTKTVTVKECPNCKEK